MPALGSDMTAGTVVEWRVKPGDRVARGDIVALVETEKGLIDVEIFDAGVVEALLVEPGVKVPVGTVLATLRADGEAVADAMPAAVAPGVAAAPAAVAPPAAVPPPVEPPPPVGAAVPPRAAARPAVAAVPPRAAPVPAPPPAATARRAARVAVSPAARLLAEELGVELATVRGSGPRGAILKNDVVAAAATRAEAPAAPPPPPASAPAPGSAAPPPSTPAAETPAAETPAPEAPAPDRLATMRNAIATAMARSKREIPHYYLATSVDVSRALAWLAAENARRAVPDRLLPAALLLRAVALAAREVPEMNGFWRDGAFRAADAVHVGVAVSLRGGGLVAPAIHDVDTKPVHEVMRALFGVIHPPQVALVGFGRIVERPWATDGLLGVRPVVVASVSGDHRASDGHRGGRFLAAIARLLAAPEAL
jgi:pyruvate dehydrogenase E2 component (dihydrolipoamide acetyltransferase)